VILYTIGLFCMENFDLGAAGRRKLEERLQAHVGQPVRFEDIQKLNVKENVIVSLRSGASAGRRASTDSLRRVHIPFNELDEIARPACLACLEFGNDYADVSAGGLGSPDGYTTVLIRTPKGSRIYGEALRNGYIVEQEYQHRTEARGTQADIVAQIAAFARRKRERGLARRRQLGVTGPIGMESPSQTI
jgi:coenzyme F420 hydrogenase subunit beta